MRCFLVTLVVVASATYVFGECLFNHREIPYRQPLYLQSGGLLDPRGFLPADSRGDVLVKSGETIKLVCAGENNYLVGGNAPPITEAKATCVADTTFIIENRAVDISQVQCFQWPYHIARDTGVICEDTGSIIDVGFPLERGFIKLMDVCFDKQSLIALSSTAYVVPGARSDAHSNDFSAYFHGRIIPSLQYSNETQLRSLSEILGEEIALELITNDNYFVNGFLTNENDFVYWPQQLATYFYVNTVPQWNEFNTGHWIAIENLVRNIATVQGDVLVVTAAYDIHSFPDINNISKPLYLYAEDGVRKMAVPDILAKMVKNQRGETVLYVSIVNRSSLEARKVNTICNDICHELDESTPWSRVSPENRNVFCCRPDDPELIKLIPRLARTIQTFNEL